MHQEKASFLVYFLSWGLTQEKSPVYSG